MRIGKRLTFLICIAANCGAAFAQSNGLIRGSVVDDSGGAVRSASVRCDTVDSRPAAKALRIVETDQAGKFTVDNLGWGSYRLFAMKESEGYPKYSIRVV